MERTHWPSAIIVVVGLWLIGATFYTDDVAPVAGPVVNSLDWNFIVVGLAFLALGFASLLTRHWLEDWALLAVSVWLAISPWVLGYAGLEAHVTTALAAAAIVALVSGFTVVWSRESRRY